MSQAASVYQRADGYWAASVLVNGKRVVKYAKTRREVQQRLYDSSRVVNLDHRRLEWAELRRTRDQPPEEHGGVEP
jgi:hypothetical protein